MVTGKYRNVSTPLSIVTDRCVRRVQIDVYHIVDAMSFSDEGTVSSNSDNNVSL